MRKRWMNVIRAACAFAFALLFAWRAVAQFEPYRACSDDNCLSGAGSPTIAPALARWAEMYRQKTGVRLAYQAIGSGGGIAQLTGNIEDFAAADWPLSHAELVRQEFAQFPVLAISVVPIVNLPGIGSGQLVIDGPTLADIYLGKITRWNDPTLKRLNPTVSLPDLAITVYGRRDGSGMTLVFTDYLSKVSPEWAAQIGSSRSPEFPLKAPCKGSDGFLGCIKYVVGAIGYAGWAYAEQNRTTVDMINAAGKRVAPTEEAAQAAIANADYSEDFDDILTNPPGDASWPVVMVTFALLRRDSGAAKNLRILKFLDYGLHEGALDSERLYYVPMPATVVRRIEESWKSHLGIDLVRAGDRRGIDSVVP